MLLGVPPPPRTLPRITPLQAARGYQQAYLQERFENAFDSVASKLTRLGYIATSAVSGEPLPRDLMETFFSPNRDRSFDGVFVLDESRTNALIQKSAAISSSVAGQLLIIRRAYQVALDGGHKTALNSPLMLWAADVVQRLRSRRSVHGAVVREDVTTSDYAEVVNGHRTRGEFVQLGSDELPGLLAFGGLRVHFEGSVTLFGSSGIQQEYLQLQLSAVLTDTFDFHEGPGTSWLDHVFVRLQRKGDAKPFRVEGRASPVALSIHGTPKPP
jgi:hypothetical protein